MLLHHLLHYSVLFWKIWILSGMKTCREMRGLNIGKRDQNILSPPKLYDCLLRSKRFKLNQHLKLLRVFRKVSLYKKTSKIRNFPICHQQSLRNGTMGKVFIQNKYNKCKTPRVPSVGNRLVRRKLQTTITDRYLHLKI